MSNVIYYKSKCHPDVSICRLCCLYVANSPGILSPMGLEKVLISVQRQESHQFIIGPAGGHYGENWKKERLCWSRRPKKGPSTGFFGLCYEYCASWNKLLWTQHRKHCLSACIEASLFPLRWFRWTNSCFVRGSKLPQKQASQNWFMPKIIHLKLPLDSLICQLLSFFVMLL